MYYYYTINVEGVLLNCIFSNGNILICTEDATDTFEALSVIEIGRNFNDQQDFYNYLIDRLQVKKSDVVEPNNPPDEYTINKIILFYLDIKERENHLDYIIHKIGNVNDFKLNRSIRHVDKFYISNLRAEYFSLIKRFIRSKKTNNAYPKGIKAYFADITCKLSRDAEG